MLVKTSTIECDLPDNQMSIDPEQRLKPNEHKR